MHIRNGIVHIYLDDRISNVDFLFCSLTFHFEIKGEDFEMNVYERNKPEFDVYRKDMSDSFKQVFGQKVTMESCSFTEKLGS